MPEHAILVDGLCKSYAGVKAVQNLSFAVDRAEIFGLLGPNGAGKTTTIRVLMDIVKADSGVAQVLGAEPWAVRDRVGYLPEERGLYRSLRVGESLIYLGQLKGMSHARAQQRAEELMAQVELAGYMRKRVQELSRGMQQRVQLVASLLHDPDLVILDEPFQGLDPVNAERVRDVIRGLRTSGKTVVLSAHEMSQVEALCDRIALIDHGRAVLYGSLAQIKQQFAPNAIEIEPPLPVDGWPEVERIEMRDKRQTVHLRPGLAPRDLLQKMVERGLTPDRFERAEMALEQIFVTVVKGGADHGPA
jgi:ABC-2 type transport system ATP-binding protein